MRRLLMHEVGQAGQGIGVGLGQHPMPETDPDNLARLADFVHEESARS